MNYLAHAYLSFRQPPVLLGNMISDFVKGKKQYGYPLPVQQGIRLHRAIDAYTDTHEAVARAKTYFRNPYGLYSAAITDVIFDHFLAADQHIFPEKGLSEFSHQVYLSLEGQSEYFPDRFSRMFPYMKEQNWLLNYRQPYGMRRSLEGLERRARYLAETETAFRIFERHYTELEGCYREFFPQVEAYARHYLEDLLSNAAKNV